MFIPMPRWFPRDQVLDPPPLYQFCIMDIIGYVVAASCPLTLPSRSARPPSLSYSRSARPRICLNSTLKEGMVNNNIFPESFTKLWRGGGSKNRFRAFTHSLFFKFKYWDWIHFFLRMSLYCLICSKSWRSS